MNMKSFTQKVRTLWETKGYIFVIVLCVAVLGGTAIVSQGAMSNATQPPIETPYLLDAYPQDDATQPPAQYAPSAAPTPAQQGAAEAGAPQDAMRVISLIEPTEGTYGMRFSVGSLVYQPTMETWGTHAGLDIQADEGQAVRAVMAGTVALIADDPINGVCVTLCHDNGMTSRYMGLSSTEGIAKDKEVTAGQIIGKVGVMPSERDEGPHLHFELSGTTGYIDPEPLLRPLDK